MCSPIEGSSPKNLIGEEPRRICIGKPESGQIERDLEQHFASGETGCSTLRRSLGALLREQLALKPEPRNPGEWSDRKYRNYKFDPPGEDRLTEWTNEHPGVFFFAYEEAGDEVAALEVELIRLAVPVLTLKQNPENPWAREVMKQRSVCAALARDSKTQTLSPLNEQQIRLTTRRVMSLTSELTLHEAMREVLGECPGRTATLSFVATQIASRGLYSQKAGGDAPPGQIRLRARNCPHLFEIIRSDKVRLK